MDQSHTKVKRFRIPERSTRIIARLLITFLIIYLVVFIVSLSMTPLGINAGEVFDNISTIESK